MTGSSPADSGHVRWGRTMAAYAGLATTVAVLLPAGRGSLSVPLGSSRDLVAWLEATPPPVIATAGLRLVALAACGYLALALTATVVAGLTPHRRLAALVGQLAPTAIRRALVCGARSGLATTVALGWWAPFTASPAGATPAAYRATSPSDDPSLHTATMSRLPAAPGSTSTRGASQPSPATDTTPVTGPRDQATRPQQPPATATMVHLGGSRGPAAQLPSPADGQAGSAAPPEPQTATTTTTEGSPRSTAPAPPQHPTTTPPPHGNGPHGTTTTQPPDGRGSASERPPPTPAPPSTTQPAWENPPPPAPARSADDEWIVAPGESFWSIAEEALRDARNGTQPADAEISRYWHDLIAANHDRLTAPDNPDLLHVGQSLVLPPPR